jgi:3-oxoacyl-[acyl-carrier-protein] synthase III
MDVMSEWVCENNSARYIMVVAAEVCDKLVDPSD